MIPMGYVQRQQERSARPAAAQIGTGQAWQGWATLDGRIWHRVADAEADSLQTCAGALAIWANGQDRRPVDTVALPFGRDPNINPPPPVGDRAGRCGNLFGLVRMATATERRRVEEGCRLPRPMAGSACSGADVADLEHTRRNDCR